MAEGAALLVDHVLPVVGYRQWVLSGARWCGFAARSTVDAEALGRVLDVLEGRRCCR